MHHAVQPCAGGADEVAMIKAIAFHRLITYFDQQPMAEVVGGHILQGNGSQFDGWDAARAPLTCSRPSWDTLRLTNCAPALHTSASHRPHFSFSCLANERTLSKLERSSGMKRAKPASTPAREVASRIARLAFSSERQANTTTAPSASSLSALANPTPLELPVTTTVLPSRRPTGRRGMRTSEAYAERLIPTQKHTHAPSESIRGSHCAHRTAER